ncbi:CDP-alcohol phosphatidyltransferase family protein [Candidatus Uhrbacteria bacterium]|nr:CDP-alcohol phosphatidyltransferase family protein [Candidatus Uhrbacteria bacterium]
MPVMRNPLQLYPHDHLMKRVVLPFIPKFVLPNHVTVFRFLATPFVVWVLAIDAYAWSIPLFLFVAFTDVIDGSLARVRKQVTEWGTFFDPIADKMLISLAAIVVIVTSVGWWLTTLVIFVELVIVLGGLLHRQRGVTVSANVWGKAKMFFQVTGVTLLLFALALHVSALVMVGTVVLIMAVILAIMSLFTYGL